MRYEKQYYVAIFTKNNRYNTLVCTLFSTHSIGCISVKYHKVSQVFIN